MANTEILCLTFDIDEKNSKSFDKETKLSFSNNLLLFLHSKEPTLTHDLSCSFSQSALLKNGPRSISSRQQKNPTQLFESTRYEYKNCLRKLYYKRQIIQGHHPRLIPSLS